MPAVRKYAKRSAPTTTTTITKKSKPLYNSIPTTVRAGKQSFPKQLLLQLVYAERITITTDAAGRGYYAFTANGLFKPNQNAAGHQPYGFDQWATMYDKNYVNDATIRVTCESTYYDNTLQTTGAWGVFPCSLATLAANPTFSYAAERPGCKWHGFRAFNSSGDQTLWVKSDMKKIYGKVLGNSQLQGTQTANPTEGSFFIIWVDEPLANAQSVTFDVQIKYNAIFDEISSTLPQS